MHDNNKKTFQAEFFKPKYWGVWLAFAIFLPLIYLPLSWQFAIGRWLGRTIFKLAKSRQRVTLINLKLAFPNLSDKERYQMAEEIFINQGIGIFESLCAWFNPQKFLNKKIKVDIDGLQYLENAQQQGKAILLLGGHYTMLDLGGVLCTQYFLADCVYRPQNNPLLEWFICKGRSHIFAKQIEHKDMRLLISSLKNGHIVWYTPDQDFGLQHGVMAEFFGVKCATITVPRRLARLGNKQNPPVVMAVHFYRKSPKNQHYQISITPQLADYPSNDEVADATRVNGLLEDFIRIAPTQWMWFHKRFKTGADGKKSSYYD
ncbi:MAG: lipid A biosynthesis acyltransferase [Moraxellaceae bacterium]|nr:lipid A biosynthesis acyltransferase [Moraxellaceae bacterium]